MIASVILKKIGECAFFHQVCRTLVQLLVKQRQKISTVELVPFEASNSKRFPNAPNLLAS